MEEADGEEVEAEDGGDGGTASRGRLGSRGGGVVIAVVVVVVVVSAVAVVVAETMDICCSAGVS